ncbi:N-6 DNA methylase [Segetibacter aerophilus]|uniref:DNA methylase adenine-specific domain-containing protein n=1 Tax=Segetibacter aerophilus TaxID=670293 RepID=A0A512BJZ8_9BACT|nr:N-6 DNA methylase [Segetibacter aerophilus]GEO12278.1 hypothetical protein SAE01_47740 [Segetibacter aerophilus]
MRKTTGKAAVVVMDNGLFEGGAAKTVRKKLLETTDVHSTLRSNGFFYANSVIQRDLPRQQIWTQKSIARD